MTSKPEIYILVGKARAGKENKYPEGEKHGVLAYVKATSHDEAEASIIKELALEGWMYLEVHKIGIIDPEMNKDDESVRAAVETGFSAVIYGGIES